MRVLAQRVSEASVRVEGEVVGAIGPGLVLLVGITHTDGVADVAWLVRKVLHLRVFSDAGGKMNASVQEAGGGLLVVSQFTLYADVGRGNRPSYVQAARPEVALPLYEAFLAGLRAGFSGPVATGRFGASMQVALVNDGPVTIWLDSQAGQGPAGRAGGPV